MMTPRLSRRRLVPWSFAVAAVIGSCNLHNPGVSPPSAVLSFPSALALSREATPRFLYVANSNFDLRYNAGSLQSYNLEALDRVLASNRCRSFGKLTSGDGGSRTFPDETRYGLLGLLDAGQGDAGASDASADGGELSVVDAGSLDAGGHEGSPLVVPDDYDLTSKYGNAHGFLCDGRDPVGYEGCCLDSEAELDAVRQSAFEIDSFAVGVGVSPQNDRVYVPVSSRNQLLYFDVVNDQLSCGSETSRCRRGPGIKSPDKDPDDNFPGSLSAMTVGTLRDLVAPTDLPVAQGLLDLGATYVATSHDLGGFGLFVEESNPPGAPSAPILEDVLRHIGQRPRSVLADPARNVIYVASAGDAFISRISVRVKSIPGETGPRALLYETSRIVVNGVSQAGDLRDMTFDPNNHNRLYVLIRGTQESVGFLDLDPSLPASNARLVDSIRIGAGPSKLAVIVQDGRTFVVVTCYDEKSIYIIDAKEHLLVSVVYSLSGPFTMAYDPSRKLLHVADFRSSVLRVVDLKGLTDHTEPPPRIVATIGSPQFQGALQ